MNLGRGGNSRAQGVVHNEGGKQVQVFFHKKFLGSLVGLGPLDPSLVNAHVSTFLQGNFGTVEVSFLSDSGQSVAICHSCVGP